MTDATTDDQAEPSIFTRIIRREVPASVVAEDEHLIELAAGDPALLAEMVAFARRIASELSDGDFRLVFNTGSNAGQTVFHVHAHVLAGGVEEDSLGTTG
jgi:histidine triad (HIT) family protein